MAEDVMSKRGFFRAIRGARVALAVAIVGVALIATATPAQAAPIGTVTLTQNGVNVIFDIELNDPYKFVETADGGGALFLFNDSVIGSTITNISATLDGTTVSVPGGLSGFTNVSPVSVVGYGDFTAFIECTDPTSCILGSAPPINDLHFTVTNVTIGQLATENSAGNIFFADTDPPVPAVPEPATLTLLAIGLGLGARGRMRR